MVSVDNRTVRVFQSSGDLFHYAAQDFFQRARSAIDNNGVFRVVLSGGQTPKAFFNALVNSGSIVKHFPWNKIEFYFGDERYVAMSDDASNYHMACEYLFSKVPVDDQRIFPMRTDIKPIQAAVKAYASILSQTSVSFDLIYLGLGDNAHTASLMPQSSVVAEYVNASSAKDHELVAEVYDPITKLDRITLTPQALNQGKAIVFLVSGLNKAEAVSHVMDGVYDPLLYPAQLIHSSVGETMWYLDKDAASLLHSNHES